MLSIITNRDLFDFPQDETEGVLVTTNGVVKESGYAVMGKGVAKQANELFKCSKRLGYLLRASGNQCYHIGLYKYKDRQYHVMSFPTKQHWRFPSTTKRIEQSAIEILKVVNDLNLKKIYLPPPGCGCGQLKWEYQVEPILHRWLDDRFIVILKEGCYGV